jgi:Zn-dependent M28 family amino/carboxypeptidase
MGLLEIALQLPKWSVKNAVSFGFWTAQEYGLVGSDHFLATRTTKQLNAIALYLDFNMIASS